MKHRPPTYIAQTQPGFEAIAAEEIAAEIEGAIPRGAQRRRQERHGAVRVRRRPARPLALRTVEDLFVQVARLPNLPPTAAALKLLRDMAASAALDQALALARQVSPGRGGRGKLRFRVVARQVGTASYRRVDAQNAVERAILARKDHRWSCGEERARVLADAAAQRGAAGAAPQRRAHAPPRLQGRASAGLVAPHGGGGAGLAHPARARRCIPRPDVRRRHHPDRRAHAGRYAQLLGGDIRLEALAIAQANVGPRHKQIELRQWDARELPIDAGAISAAAVNLPSASRSAR